MSDTTVVLSLPYILPSQAQKHVTHNEALEMLDILVQASALDQGLTAPPTVPVTGERHIVGAGATGVWAGHDQALAIWVQGQGWQFHAPKRGWRVYVEATGVEMVWTGTAWQALGGGSGSGGEVEMIGVSTSADATNRLAVASEASLFTHAGAGHQIKVNKATATDTASLLFQDNWSGRAEMGLAGTDDFEIKVSANGSGFQSALRAQAATGLVTLPNGLVLNGAVSGTGVQSSQADATAGRLLKVGAFGLGAVPALIGNAAVTDNSIAPGFYNFDTAAGSSGGPSSVKGGILLHQRRSDGNEVQMLLIQSSTSTVAPAGIALTRIRAGGAWGSWANGSALSTGGTTDGRYERNHNGNQTCWQTVTTLATGELVVTYPSAFVSGGLLVSGCTVVSTADQAVVPRITARTNTGFSISAFSTSNARVAVQVDVITQGRWF